MSRYIPEEYREIIKICLADLHRRKKHQERQRKLIRILLIIVFVLWSIIVFRILIELLNYLPSFFVELR
jgi:hypothetical protein